MATATYRHTDGRFMFLGKKPAKVDPRTLRLAKYLTPELPAPPPACDWTKGVTSWGMMENDQLGDCTCAAAGHGVQVATLNSYGIVTPPDSTIQMLYQKACGYVPGNPNTDQGGVIIDVLNWIRQYAPWHHKGKEGHRHHPYQLYAYADPDHGNIIHIKQSIQWFGTVNIGLQLPLTAQAQVGGLWKGVPNADPNSQPGSWGGHSVIVCAYDHETVTCITWGALQKMTWEFWRAYVDEAHALLFRAWVQRFTVPMLKPLMADLALVAS